MSTFSGPQKKGAGKPYARPAADHREQKRIDAELRAEDTTHERTRAHREERCDC